MAPSQHAPSLRAINYRLSSTPAQDLPLCAAQVAASLWDIKDLLSAPTETLKANAELSALVHRFKTTLSSLLQDRTCEGRWAAIVIAKSAIEAGGVEILSKSGVWVKNLLTILKKPDPPTTKILAAITLTRIFSLTWDHSQLIREITTPALPTFISSCLSNIESKRCSPGELQTVLEAFSTLVPRHPTIFRTHEAQIRKVLARILCGSSSSGQSSMWHNSSHVETAQKLFVLLHHCAVKQGGADKWKHGVRWAVSAAHETCDILFRPISETSSRPRDPVSNSTNGVSGVNPSKDDALDLTPWNGVYAGAARLTSILGVIEAQVRTATSNSVHIPVGLIYDLLSRIFMVTAPLSPGASVAKFNPEVARDEREAMFSSLPRIHIAALAVVDTLLTRLGGTLTSTIQSCTELIEGLFLDECSDTTLRAAVFRTTRIILGLVGPNLSKENAADLVPIIKACCDDLLTTDELSRDHRSSAQSLLSQLFSEIDQAHIPRQIRVQMERTAVLTNDHDALLSCILNPARKDSHTTLQPSLLPILASLHSDGLDLEALIRPRMPPITTTAGENSINAMTTLVTSEANTFDTMQDVQQIDDISGSTLASKATSEVLQAEAKDLDSSSPQSDAQLRQDNFTDLVTSSLLTNAQLAPKRQALDSIVEDVQAKRFRASSPVTHSPISEETGSVDPLEKTGHKKLDFETPAQDLNEGVPIRQSMTLVEEDSDDSDFEMPEINPDPDTDSEDDEA